MDVKMGKVGFQVDIPDFNLLFLVFFTRSRGAVRRGLSNVAIQAYLTAAVINLKRLAAFFLLFFSTYRLIKCRQRELKQMSSRLVHFWWLYRKNNIMESITL